MGSTLQPHLHSQPHGLDGAAVAGPPRQPPPLLQDRGGDVQLDAVHGGLLELVRRIQHCREWRLSRLFESAQISLTS